MLEILNRHDLAEFCQDRSIRPPCWILKIVILNVLWHQGANARHHVKFRQTWSNVCGDIEILRVFKLAGDAILDFQKFNFLTADKLERPTLHNPAKFHQGRSIYCRDMAIF